MAESVRPDAFGFASAEAALLADALELEPARISARSREPLGAGSVAGFAVRAADELVYFVDTSRQGVLAETGMARGEPGAPDARVWLHPADPHLPALAPAAFGEAATALLARLGLQATGAPRIVGYRPGRRAVLRIDTDTGGAWLKVVRPSRVARIVDAHARLSAAGIPVPALTGWSREGLLVMPPAAGTAAPDVEWNPERLLDLADALRRRFAETTLPHRARTSVGARVPWYVDGLRAELPDRADDICALGASIMAALARAGPADAVTIHGDLHFGQLFLGAGDRIATVIDVDTAGTGDPADDASAFTAHAFASSLLTRPAAAPRVRRLAQLARARWQDEDRAAPLTAVHLLGHALGAAQGGALIRAGLLVDAATDLVAGSPWSGPVSKGGLTVRFEGA